jgi:hypothetical protein
MPWRGRVHRIRPDTGGEDQSTRTIKPEPENHQGHQVSRRIQYQGFPSYAFVAFVVDGLATFLPAAAQLSAFRQSGAGAHPRWWWSRV